MICIKCKHAKFVLTSKKSKIARWGMGKCTAQWEVPTLDVSKIPAVVKITVKFSEAEIDQALISFPDLYDDNPREIMPEECPLFEEDQVSC